MTGGAAIYARFSSEMQREASIDDQIGVCTAHLERDGWSVVETYADHVVSSASALRPGYQALLGDARAKRFDLVIAESLDRFSVSVRSAPWVRQRCADPAEYGLRSSSMATVHARA